MFRIKICGVTTLEDGQAAARAGADAIGLNFYPESPRFIEADRAAAIASQLPSTVLKVGVFVNTAPAVITDVADRVTLDAVQLHGDEPPEWVQVLAPRAVIRAFRLGREGLGPVIDYLEACRQLGHLPSMTLIDARVAGAFGGTGRTADWATAAGYPAAAWHPPAALAGGLGPENVVKAIWAVRPRAVDTASGVESRPGRKDIVRVEAFVRRAREAFAALERPASE